MSLPSDTHMSPVSNSCSPSFLFLTHTTENENVYITFTILIVSSQVYHGNGFGLESFTDFST